MDARQHVCQCVAAQERLRLAFQSGALVRQAGQRRLGLAHAFLRSFQRQVVRALLAFDAGAGLVQLAARRFDAAARDAGQFVQDVLKRLLTFD